MIANYTKLATVKKTVDLERANNKGIIYRPSALVNFNPRLVKK